MTDANTVSFDDPSAYGEELESREMGPKTEAMFNFLASRVIGQDRVARRLARGFTNFHAGLKDPRSPIYVGLFAGPTGTGKTMTAEEISRYLIGDVVDAPLTRIACTALTERHEVSTLIGSPPGYIGHGDPAVLQQLKIDERHFRALVAASKEARAALAAVKGKDKDAHDSVMAALYKQMGPFFSVILFDEIEKAHQTICRLLLNIMNEGELRMKDGTKTIFTNSVIILTSNVGGRDQQERIGKGHLGFTSASAAEEQQHTDQELYDLTVRKIEETFDPEFVGRVKDQIVVFRPLTPDDVRLALANRYHEVVGRLNASRKTPISLNFTDPFTEFMVREGYNRQYGMRPLNQAVNRWVLLPLAAALEAEDIRDGDTVYFVMKGKEVRLRRAPRPVQVPVTIEQVDSGWDENGDKKD